MLLFELFQVFLPLGQIFLRFRHFLGLVVQNCIISPSASLPEIHCLYAERLAYQRDSGSES